MCADLPAIAVTLSQSQPPPILESPHSCCSVEQWEQKEGVALIRQHCNITVSYRP